ncbi:MAG: putative addiction module antidote protein [Chloroflexota bacterium]|nr:putative addiction module antidote protein [Chloroflexota bacterium]MDE2884375.1 putative addiction module antidote protein [Chloroflexota bacterium]
MARTKTLSWDPAEHLETEEDIAAYLNVALEEGDLSLIMATLGDIARARRMAMVAQESGLGRESLYKSLSADGNPEFGTVLKVLHALGLQLQASATTRPSTGTQGG